MARAGRPQGALKGSTRAANELAGFVRNLTGPLTVRELSARYGGGRTLWSEYRSGAKVIPLGVLRSVLRDRIRDARAYDQLLDRARRLHDAALVAAMRAAPALGLGDALQRAEADLDDAGRVVQSLLALVAMLMPDAADPEHCLESALLGEALDQLDAALAVRAGAARVRAEGAGARRGRFAGAIEGGEAEEGTAGRGGGEGGTEPAEDTSGAGEIALAGPALALALARVGSAVEERRTELVRLWGDVRETCPPRSPAVAPTVELHRLDRSLAVRRWRGTYRGRDLVRRGAPPPARGMMPGFLGVLSVLVVAALLTVVTVSGRHAGAPAGGTALLVDPLPRIRSGPPLLGPTASATPLPSVPPTPAGDATPSSPGQVPQSPPPNREGAGTLPAPSPSGSGPRTTPSVSPDPSSRPAPGEPPPLPDSWFRLTNSASRMCLTVPGADPTPATGLVQNGCGAGTEQFWQLNPEADGTYSIRNVSTGLCMSVDAARTEPDAIVTQFHCGDDSTALFPDQYWTLRYHSGNQAWQVVNRNSGKCASVPVRGGNMEQVLQSDCAVTPEQFWRT